MTSTLPPTSAPTTPPGAGADRAPRAPRCWSLHGPKGAVDVEVTARDDDELGAVLPALRRALGVPVEGLWSGTTRLGEDLRLTSAHLRHGALLGLDRPGPRGRPDERRSALELHVVGGPEAGRTAPLAQGRHIVGRGAEATIRLADPGISRAHVEVRVGGGVISVADLGSTNGTRLGEEDLTSAARPWPARTVVRVGSTALTVTGPSGAPAATTPVAGGRAQLRSQPRLSGPPVEAEVPFPAPPTPPQPRRLAWIAVALPALGGITLAVVLRTPTFLFFALLSPVAALGTWWSDRWSGRRTRRRDAASYTAELRAAEDRLAAAVRADVQAAEADHPDLAGLATAARRRTALLWTRRADDDDALTVRLGTGPGPSRAVRRGADGARVHEPAPHLPAALDLRRGGLAVVGPRTRRLGVLRSVLAQLAALHPPDAVELVLLVGEEHRSDWSWTRWLPHLGAGSVALLERATTRPSGPPTAAAPTSDGGDDTGERMRRWLSGVVAGRRPGSRSAPPPSWLVVVVDGPLPAEIAELLRRSREAGVVVLTSADSAEALPAAAPALLRLTGETGDLGVLSRSGTPDRRGITVDQLPVDAAAGLARDLAGLVPATGRKVLPDRVRLLDLPGTGMAIDPPGAVGHWTRTRHELVATLGRTADRVFRIDLCRHGPHLLVAGTTGSGKSELLQTLITDLALRHPPDRCAFLLVDYKGGAAFAEAAALPHTVGLVTDLEGAATERALRSLTAELARREALLADAGVADIAQLPDSVPLARLVIVVDEFATLAEELPGFVPGLVGIAQRGRSLGVHLVLATQRPAGAVSPEIRANCALRICLRTADEADSRDVLGTADAAHLPADLPGRAFVRSGSGPPEAIQVARVAQPFTTGDGADPQVRPWPWPGVRITPEPSAARESDSDLATVVHALGAHARRTGTTAPHRPWRAPLPERLTGAEVLARTDEPRQDGAPWAEGRPQRLVLGLIDRPERQAQEALLLDLARGGGWLAVGGPRSGRTSLLRSVLAGAVRQLDPDRVHVHVIDLGGGTLAAEAATLPHTGTAIGREDAFRIVRLLDRLGDEIAARRAAPADDRPLVLLLVDGVEAVSALLDEADPAHGSAGLHRLVRDGAAVGLTCVITADRAVPGGRLAAVATRRLVLPLADRADYAVAGIPPRAVPSVRPPGRALLGEDAVEVQLVLPEPGPVTDARPCPGEEADQSPGPEPGRRPASARPLHIAELDPDPELDARPASGAGTGLAGPGSPRPIVRIGPGGDDGSVQEVDLLRGGGLLITGPPGSGRSAAIDALAAELSTCGVPTLRLGRPTATGSDAGPATGSGLATGPATGSGPSGGSAPERPGDTEEGPGHPVAQWAAAGDVATVAGWLQALDGRPGVVLVDDLGAPADAAALGALPPLGAGSGVALVAAGAAGQLSAHFQGPVAALRRQRSGLLLCPTAGEADLLGLRLPRLALPVRPGSGWLVSGGEPRRVQVARRVGPFRAENGNAG